MPGLRLRWSEHEARKPYARPFGVTFIDDDGQACGSLAVSGPDLLYLHQFRAAVLALGGELFDDPALRQSEDPQRAWLDRMAELLPPAGGVDIAPRSSFDHELGRTFAFEVRAAGVQLATVDAAQLLEYQEFQAALAHQSGLLFRAPQVEDIADQISRQAAWLGVLRERLARPGADEAMSEKWPWR